MLRASSTLCHMRPSVQSASPVIARAAGTVDVAGLVTGTLSSDDPRWQDDGPKASNGGAANGRAANGAATFSDIDLDGATPAKVGPFGVFSVQDCVRTPYTPFQLQQRPARAEVNPT